MSSCFAFVVLRRLTFAALASALPLALLCWTSTVQAQAPSPPLSRSEPADKIDPDPIGPAPTEADASSAARDTIGVPARVWAVRIAGGWEAQAMRGFSRVIGTFEGDRQKLTVQWLAEPDARVVASQDLDDEEASKLTFGDFRAEPGDRGGVTVFLDTIPDADGLRDTWVLVIGEPGDARFGPATN